MGRPGALEMKRIIAAIKCSDPLADPINGVVHPPRDIIRPQDEKSARQSLKEAGLDFDEITNINKKLRIGQLKRLRAGGGELTMTKPLLDPLD